MATLFSVGQAVKFKRNNLTKSDSTVVSAIVEKPAIPQNVQVPAEALAFPQTYVIEYEGGWVPNILRQQSFNLDSAKKYLFVSENELTAI